MIGKYNDKQLHRLLVEVSKTTNPFGIMDIALHLGYARNHNGIDQLDITHDINAQRIGKFIAKNPDFERYARKSNSHVRWYYKEDTE